MLVITIPEANWVTQTEEEVHMLEEKNLEKRPCRVHATPEEQKIVDFIRDQEQRFDQVKTIRWESGFDPEAIWDWKDGVPTSYWLCQRHGEKLRLEKYTDDPIIGDRKEQVLTCLETWEYREKLWTLNTWLYAYNTKDKRDGEFVRKVSCEGSS